jgi:phosphoglycerate kinase
MTFKTLDDMDLAGKIVLTRVDINVPVEDGKVTDATRIERIVPTIKDIQAKGGKPVLLAHFGRPKGKPNPEFSLRVTVPALEKALGQSITFIETPDRATLENAPADAVILVENTRFSPMEEKPTTRKWRSFSPRWATSIAMMPFPQRTAPTPPPKASRACCPPAPGG